MATLPVVLAGPVVRRVEPEHASFWIALSEPGDVAANVWVGRQRSTGAGLADPGGNVVATGTASTRRFGAHLHVAVVTADATSALAPGELHSYDLTVTAAGTSSGLRDLGLLRDEQPGSRLPGVDPGTTDPAPLHLALGYATDMLPSFVTPGTTIPDVCLVQASCRKTNGDGPDAMAWLDDQILQHLTDPVKRPQQLFLTGDQIYADEVGACLLPMLTQLAADMLGFTPTLPIGGAEVSATLVNLPALRRERLVREIGRFTTTSGDSHLLTFGEYAAMYMAVWSPRVWRPLASADLVFTGPPANADTLHLTDWEGCHGSTARWKAKSQGGFDDEAKRVRAFRDEVPRVARALANVATYMIFDDHEVTDDWYISKRWRSRVLTAPLGRTIIRNGLAAYAIFQAWGNDPGGFRHGGAAATPPNETLLDNLAAMATEGAALTPATRDSLDQLLGLTQPAIDPKVAFHYAVPGPRHLVRVLDTRTRRRYTGEGHSPPKLLGDSLDAQLPAGPLTDGREVLVVVSAAPVLFPRLFDTLVQPAAAGVFDLRHHMFGEEDPHDPCRTGPTIVGSEDVDVEGWHGDEVHQEAFLRRAATYRRVVLFSGDVHFASSLVLDFWARGDEALDSRVVQLTSSAARNQPGAGMRAVLRAFKFGQLLLRGLPYERLGWTGKATVQLPAGASIRPGRRARLRRTPGLLPAAGWPTGTTVPADQPPDYHWRLTVLRDERLRTQMPVGTPVLPALPAWNPGDALDGYAKVAAAHAQMSFDVTDPFRLMVFRSNIGLVRFTVDGGDVAVQHQLLSPADDGTTGEAFTEHMVAFAPTPAPAPPQLQTG
jgi:hypothetical protein